jgi:hypothetical protein
MNRIAFLIALVALPLHADLASDIRAADGWVGYSVPLSEGQHNFCSWDAGDFTPASALTILYRIEKREIVSMKLSSPECPATHEVRWLPSVDPAESLRLLRVLVDSDRSIGKKAVTALALHEGSEEELLWLARRHPSAAIRSSSLFWVGQVAGRRAAATLRDAVDHDPDEDVKEKAVFGISQLPNDQSVPLLIELLKTHRSRQVRKKAAFWLSQKDDPRALAAFEEILRK